MFYNLLLDKLKLKTKADNTNPLESCEITRILTDHDENFQSVTTALKRQFGNCL